MGEMPHPGRLLRDLRTREGLSQRQVAVRLGISRSTVANLEAERHRMSDELLARLDKLLPEWHQAVTRGRLPKPAESFNPSLRPPEVGPG